MLFRSPHRPSHPPYRAQDGQYSHSQYSHSQYSQETHTAQTLTTTTTTTTQPSQTLLTVPHPQNPHLTSPHSLAFPPCVPASLPPTLTSLNSDPQPRPPEPTPSITLIFIRRPPPPSTTHFKYLLSTHKHTPPLYPPPRDRPNSKLRLPPPTHNNTHA